MHVSRVQNLASSWEKTACPVDRLIPDKITSADTDFKTCPLVESRELRPAHSQPLWSDWLLLAPGLLIWLRRCFGEGAGHCRYRGPAGPCHAERSNDVPEVWQWQRQNLNGDRAAQVGLLCAFSHWTYVKETEVSWLPVPSPVFWRVVFAYYVRIVMPIKTRISVLHKMYVPEL